MLVIFPGLFCFSLLYLELQRSDDDADALWVYSSAGAAQRYPPSDQNGGKRKHATPTPFIPFGLLVADLSPFRTSLAPNGPQISESIGIWKNTYFLIYTKYFLLIQWCQLLLFIGCVQIALTLHSVTGWSPTSNSLRWFMGAERVPVWCSRCSARGCWSAAVSSGHSASAAAK